MLSARITVDPAFTIGPVRPRTFGSFVEHLGRAVYTGIYEPDHHTADADGFRQDVIEHAKELGVTTVRYPGGNFVSGHRWEDGIGPVADRPTRLDLAWHSSEPNTFGLNEFMRWTQKADIEPMMAINLGTRGVQEALDILEYCNVPGGTLLSELRKEHGHDQPHRIRIWCLGNEMDGSWQTGHKTAKEYARLAAETARAMRMIDPDLELVVCGSSGRGMETFGDWERIVLTETYDLVDYISAHAYYHEENGDLASFLASAVNMDQFIDDVVVTADAVRAAGNHKKRINISFDEWNVWYINQVRFDTPTGNHWPIAPRLLEDNYSVADAVVVGNLLISLLRHTDRVHAASQAQLVNVIAPIMTDPADEGGRIWKQTTYHPFALTSKYAKGEVLNSAVESPLVNTAKYGEVPALDAVVTYNKDSGAIAVFAVNRSVTDTLQLEIDLRGLAEMKLVEALTFANPDDVYWTASAEDDYSVVPTSNTTATVNHNVTRADLPPVSWTMIRLTHN